MGAKVQNWKKEKKNLRALLADLHNIAPPCSWKQKTLGELLDKSQCKKAYHKVSKSLHPDRIHELSTPRRAEAEEVFKLISAAYHTAPITPAA